MIIRSNLNYTSNGRRRKTVTSKKYRAPFEPLVVKPTPKKQEIPSAPITPYRPEPDMSFKREVSAKYTVAIAYNKGAYQVISAENVKHIGK